MAIYYEKWYRMYGVRQPNQLLSPIVTDGEQFEFPVGTRFHWFKPSERDLFIDKDISYLNKTEKVVIDTVLDYPEEVETTGKFNRLGRSNFKVLEFASKKEPDFTFLKYKQTMTYIDKTLNIYTYGNLAAGYKYQTYPFRSVDIYRNTLRTLIYNLGKTERHEVILIDLPKIIPSRIDLDRYSENLKQSYLAKLPSYKYFNVLELWKLLTPEFKEESLFSKIPQKLFSKIDLMFCYNDKVVIINFEKLYYLVKDYQPEDYKTTFYSLKPALAKKLFYMFLYSIINNSVSKTEKETIASLNIQGADETKNVKINLNSIKDDREAETEIEKALDENIPEMILPDIKEDDKLDLEVLEKDDEEIFDNVVDDSIPELQALLDESVDNLTNAARFTLDSIQKEIYEFNNVKNIAEKLKEDSVITKKQNSDIIRILDQQQNLTMPYDKHKTLSEELDYNKDDFKLPEKDLKINPVSTIFDDSTNNITTQAMHKSYLNNQYRKDITRTLYSLQNFNLAVENYEIKEDHTIMDSTETHVLKVKFPTGGSSTLQFVLPKINEDGSMMRYGGNYLTRYLRTDLPIRKLDYNNVMLSSGYGKMLVSKGEMSFDNKGNWLANQIKKSDHESLSEVILGENDNVGVKAPQEYSLLARCIRSLKIGTAKYSFNYKNRINLIKDLTEEKLKELEGDNKILLGVQGNKPILIRDDGRYFKYDGNAYNETKGIIETLNLDLNDGPMEFITVRIYKKLVPVCILLSYYIGFSNLLQLLKSEYTFTQEAKRVVPGKDEYVIKFLDTTYKIKRDNGIGDLILGGFVKLKPIIQNIPKYTLEKKENFSLFFARMDYSLSYITEIKLLETMFVDPVTLTVLKENNQPTSFKGLLIKASEMLVNDYYENPNDIKGSRIRGYDRIPTMIYKELVQALRVKENSAAFGKQTMIVNPYNVYNKIFDDSTTVLIDDLNPMAYIKQTEDVSQIGDGGRRKVGMNKETRIMDTTEIGIISEAARDSTDVGITGYFTANPKITSTRGDIGDFDIKKDGWASAISTSAMLSPFGLMDDTKRLNFSSIMKSHVVPIKGSHTPYVRTGYESIIPVKAGDKFVISAKEDGKVLSVSKNNIEVEYKTLGKKKYKIADWTSKEESEACYTHVMKSNMKAGDTFKKDDSLVYDSTFFGIDIFNPNRVIYKEGDTINVALTEDPQTYEDSSSISKTLNNRLGTIVTKVVNIIFDVKDNISGVKQPGEKVGPSDPLVVITNQILGGAEMDEKAIEIMSSLNKQAPKAKYKGTINKLDVRYNAELDDMSKSVRELVEKIDKISMDKYGYTNKVNDSYSYHGKPLLPGTMILKVYLDVDYGMGIGDKMIIGNQLKCTIGEVYENEVKTEDGTPVECFFSTRSIAARIVASPYLWGSTNTLLEKLGELAVEAYFGKE